MPPTSLLAGLKQAAAGLRGYVGLPANVRDLKDQAIAARWETARATHPNPLNRCARKCFSQSDEDGITLEILRRIGLSAAGTYLEYGVEDGLENNTLVLAAMGWRGAWIGGDALAFDVDPARARGFAYERAWVTLDNVLTLARGALARVGAEQADVVSLDLDGNDWHFARALLAGGLRPSLFVVEYNAKFPPPVPFVMPYDAAHAWTGDAWFGASLQSFTDLFEQAGYRLVCCNAATGANAFFVDARHDAAFADVPRELSTLYVEPRYALPVRAGVPVSARMVRSILEGRTRAV